MDRFFASNAELSKFSRDYMEHRKNLPVRPSETMILDVITSLPGMHTPAGLAKLFDVSKPMITAHINALLKRGYITKEPSPHDKRSFRIHPTQKGLELMEEINRRRSEFIGYLMDNMGEEDFEKLISLVKKANQVLEKKRISQDSSIERD